MKVILIIQNQTDADAVRQAYSLLGKHDDVIHIESGDSLFSCLDSISPEEISYILLDIHFPQERGFEIMKKLTGHAFWHQLPVIVLSTFKGKEDIMIWYRAGANAIVNKPQSKDSLLQTIRSIDEFWGKINLTPSLPQAW